MTEDSHTDVLLREEKDVRDGLLHHPATLLDGEGAEPGKREVGVVVEHAELDVNAIARELPRWWLWSG